MKLSKLGQKTSPSQKFCRQLKKQQTSDIKVVLDDTLVEKLAPSIDKDLAVLKRRSVAYLHFP
ncbi:hypothetical protein [Bacillus sp. FJAT-29814]|uniref:hypothetical protein n=1 Tax=Bacillus sp. FJAT-29814 TaxID=1729688 RepID=UPI000831EE3F|nr:hypothetical protein [Bacillus sp. FJAT-29814]